MAQEEKEMETEKEGVRSGNWLGSFLCCSLSLHSNMHGMMKLLTLRKLDMAAILRAFIGTVEVVRKQVCVSVYENLCV